MNRIWSLASVLGVIALICVGMMYIADWMTSVKWDRRTSALADVVSFVASRLAIDQSGEGVPLETVMGRIRSHRSLESIPVVFMTHSDVSKHPSSILMVSGRGVEAVVVVVDEPDPYRAIRRVWVTDATLLLRYRTPEDRILFRVQDVVEGGDPFSF